MRAVKIAGWVVAGLVLVLGAGAAAVMIGGAPLVARLVEARGSALLARPIKIGHLDIRWGRPIRIIGEDIHVANADWGSTPDMLATKRLEMELDPTALLRLGLRIESLAVEQPAVFLEVSKDGKRNWATSDQDSDLSKLRRIVAGLHEATVRQGRFQFRNGQTRAETDISIDELSAEMPDADSPIKLAASGVLQRQPFAATAEIGALTRWQEKHEPHPVKLAGHLGANNFTVDGTVGDPLTLQPLALQVDLTGQDIQQLLATLGVPIPKMPIYHLAGHVRRDGAQWHFDGVTGHIGESHLAGDILLDEGGRVPYIRALLTAEYLDLADLRGFYGGDPNERKRDAASDAQRQDKGRVIPDTRLPIAQWQGLNADVSLDAPRVKPAAGIPFERLSFTLSLQDGTLRLSPVRVAVARGETTAELDLHATETPPRFGADLDIRHVDLHQLLAGMNIREELKQTAGVMGGFAKLQSSGATQRQILLHLNGDIGLFLQGGRLSQAATGLFERDVAEALGLVEQSRKPRPINCFIARFSVKDGVATATTLLLDTAETIVTGEGNINLADETLFLDLKPYPKQAGSGRFGVPLEIRGTFAHPEVTSEKVGLAKRLGAAIGMLAPPAVLLPLVDRGLGDKNKCAEAFAAPQPTPTAEGSSRPERTR